MIRLLAIDDEPLALQLLEVYIKKIPGLQLLATCTSPREAQPWLDQADALLVDINMPDINGMDFVRSLEDPPLVIFTTAYAEYAVDGFRVNAVDYLLKPFSFNEFLDSIKKLEDRLSMKRALDESKGNFLCFNTANHGLRIDTRRIRYIEGMGEYLKIHLDGEEAPVIVLYRMKNIAEELPQERFFRIHRSYIIALDRVLEARRNEVTLDDKTKLPVGESYRESWWEKMGRI
jgi:DNA-binding LytR/AlgR family response regulator